MRTSPNLHKSLELSGWIFAKKLKSVNIQKNFTHATVPGLEWAQDVTIVLYWLMEPLYFD
jgi:hypothetical protein